MPGQITVANRRQIQGETDYDDDIYIGRPSILGNPFRISADRSREEAIALFQDYLSQEMTKPASEVRQEINHIINRVRQGRHVRLMCFCAPQPCHGDVIAKFVCEQIKNTHTQDKLEEKPRFSWSRTKGYEVSTAGDSRFSAFVAKMPDGRSIEQWYQCDIKGYDIGGTNWRLGKGKPAHFPYPADHLWQMYLSLWRLWTIHNGELMNELMLHATEHDRVLCDRFANSPINQAHALATILNEWIAI